MDYLTYVLPFFVFILSYHFHVIVDDGLIYLCMADEDFGKRQPYAFLEEVTFFGLIPYRAVVCLVARSLNESEVGIIDLVLIETSLLFLC